MFIISPAGLTITLMVIVAIFALFDDKGMKDRARKLRDDSNDYMPKDD